MDLDLGLAFTLVGEARYQEVAERLSLTFATATGFERN
jgi:hypothetical protein